MSAPDQIVTIDYTNWRGERSKRQIRPIALHFENNKWHPDTQWLLEAEDQRDKRVKSFAMRNIHSWEKQP